MGKVENRKKLNQNLDHTSSDHRIGEAGPNNTDALESSNKYKWNSNHSSTSSTASSTIKLIALLILANVIIQGLNYWRGHFSRLSAIELLVLSILIIIAYIRISTSSKSIYQVDSEGISVNNKKYLWSDVNYINIKPDSSGWSMELVPKTRLRLMPIIYIENESDIKSILPIIDGNVNIKI